MPKFPVDYLTEYDTEKRSGLPPEETERLIVKAIVKLHSSSKNKNIQLKRTKTNGFAVCSRNEILSLLCWLENGKHIIKVDPASYPYEVIRPKPIGIGTGDSYKKPVKIDPKTPISLEVLPVFDLWYKQYLEDEAARTNKEILYRITFNDMQGKIMLNEKKCLSRPRYDSENEVVIQYLIAHPNQKITKKEIEENTGIKIGKDFHKIVDNFGFPSALKRAFFKISKSAIFFRNPITKGDYKKLGLPPLKIAK